MQLTLNMNASVASRDFEDVDSARAVNSTTLDVLLLEKCKTPNIKNCKWYQFIQKLVRYENGTVLISPPDKMHEDEEKDAKKPAEACASEEDELLAELGGDLADEFAGLEDEFGNEDPLSSMLDELEGGEIGQLMD